MKLANESPSRGDEVLRLDGVTKEYPGPPPVVALDDVTLVIRPAELVAVVGASGSGKSTLMNVIGTLDRPSAGAVEIEGRSLSDMSDARLAALRSARLGFVFQQFHLLESMTALENVATGLLYRGLSARERRSRAFAALDRVGLAERAKHRPPQMSGGERQRVAIARAIVGEPAIVLADEPTGNLDSANSEAVMGVLRSLHEDGGAILVITHDRQIAASLPRQITMRDGRIVDDTRGAEPSVADRVAAS